MPRRPRSWISSICFHLINRALNRNPIFHSPNDCLFFLDLLHQWKSKTGAKIYHWCLMSNHYHLLAEVQPDRLSRSLGTVQQRYALYHHRVHKTCGYLWQGRFKAKPVELSEAIAICGRYVERNPVRAGLVVKAWEYRWSSARFYVLNEPDPITDLNPYFGGSWDEQQRQRYTAELENLEQQDRAWLKENESTVIGSSAFRSTLTLQQGHFRLRRGRSKLSHNNLNRNNL